jgi:hypothetical protein
MGKACLDKIKLGSAGKGEAIKSGQALEKPIGGVIPLSKTKSSDLKR